MATKNNPGAYDCYAAADPDEPLFVLLARDKHAPTLIWLWATLRELEGEDPAKVQEARECVVAMLAWQTDNGRTSIGIGQAALAGVMELIRAANAGVKNAPNASTTTEILRLYLAKTTFEGAPVDAVAEALVPGADDLDLAVGGTSSEDEPSDADARVRIDWSAVDAGGEAPPVLVPAEPFEQTRDVDGYRYLLTEEALRKAFELGMPIENNCPDNIRSAGGVVESGLHGGFIDTHLDAECAANWQRNGWGFRHKLPEVVADIASAAEAVEQIHDPEA
jgi:hypothetical protein